MTATLQPGTVVGGDFEILRPLKQGEVGAGETKAVSARLSAQ
jgi:hypothetical protein